MLRLYKGPDPAHVYQLKCQIGLTHEAGPRIVKRCYNSGRLPVQIAKDTFVCPEHRTQKCLRDEQILEPDHGFLYYVSRDHPADTWEFYFEYDPKFMEEGRRQLAKWRQHFLDGKLPQDNFEDKRFSHPWQGWAWTKSLKDPDSPCQYCDYGDICREDHKQAVKDGKPINLADSHAIEAAREVRVDYSFDLVRKAVLKRWGFAEEEAQAA
jgi:hypothetical protein